MDPILVSKYLPMPMLSALCRDTDTWQIAKLAR